MIGDFVLSSIAVVNGPGVGVTIDSDGSSGVILWPGVTKVSPRVVPSVIV